MEKSEVIQKFICTFLWSENIRFYIFTSENIKYTIYINNIFLYFTTLYIIKEFLAFNTIHMLTDRLGGTELPHPQNIKIEENPKLFAIYASLER